MSFDQELRTKVLLWCDRHCCLCKKPCGINIEVHHIIPEAEGGPSNLENAIPLCFDCHGDVGHYNNQQPRGNKFKVEELKARREQVYEEFTRHLVPPVHYEITNNLGETKKRTFPDVGFNLAHFGDSLPVKVKTMVEAIREGSSPLKMLKHYGGEVLWNLNPRFHYSGHFQLPDAVKNDSKIRLRVCVTIIDQYERCHDHLPVHYIYEKKGDYWYFDA